MANTNKLSRDKQGRYYRQLGWKRTRNGYTQPKFYLGRDVTKASIAVLKLQQLWETVCRRWEAANLPTMQPKPDADMQSLVKDSNGAKAVVSLGVAEVEYVRDGKPVWDEVSFVIANAIRNGEAVARVSVPEHLGQFGLESSPVGHWLHTLRGDVPYIHIELSDPERQRQAEAQIQAEGTRLMDRARPMIHQSGGGETLHIALREYAKSLKKKHVNLDGTVNPTGTTQARQTQFLEQHLPDCPLAELDTLKILSFQETLALRPPGKRAERITARSARNYIKQLRHFIRWLSTAPGFSWKRPSDLEFTSIRIPQTAQEKAAKARTSRVDTYSVNEIHVLWEHATPLKRLLLLLGLNCGFDAKMIATLQPEDVCLHQRHPGQDEIGLLTSEDDSWIFRLRNKTDVYGEWKLWPITVDAIEWWFRRRDEIAIAEGVTALLVNRSGLAYDTPTARNDRNVQIPNHWSGLTEKIRKDDEHKDFRKLSFGKLRKTGGNLIRAEAGGEVAGVFLCHGTPEKSDELLDAYTNRPFAKVFEAIDIVGLRLSHIWSSVENPFPEVRKKGGSNISVGKIQRIQKMRRQGYRVNVIAEKLGVSKQTVSRHSSKKPR